jgi:hypothetical protein
MNWLNLNVACDFSPSVAVCDGWRDGHVTTLDDNLRIIRSELTLDVPGERQ